MRVFPGKAPKEAGIRQGLNDRDRIMTEIYNAKLKRTTTEI